ncbi:UNVERIFIED_CONTAM: hypothetical protein Scaly_2760300 [Sesamum calycinum]|uniref:Uncharacterized protein n=1 Tax=Sesamum calycinum TaxID=2727403 RepID=A0AAW2IZQ1_9LAMI
MSTQIKFKSSKKLSLLPTLIKLQGLTGRVVGFSRFISHSTESSLPFFKAIRRTKNFVGDEEHQQAFQNLKAYLDRLPLYLYVAVGQHTTSFVLIKEEEEHQKPIYYVSKPRTTIKFQALVEFVNEATLVEEDEGNWLLHADDSCTLPGSGAIVDLTSPKGNELEYALRFNLKPQTMSTHTITIRTLLKNPHKSDIAILQIATNWWKPLMDYLKEEVLPTYEMETTRLRNRAARFALLDVTFISVVSLNLIFNACQQRKIMGRLKSLTASWYKESKQSWSKNVDNRSEVIILAEAKVETFRIQHYKQGNNENFLQTNFNFEPTLT